MLTLIETRVIEMCECGKKIEEDHVACEDCCDDHNEHEFEENTCIFCGAKNLKSVS